MHIPRICYLTLILTTACPLFARLGDRESELENRLLDRYVAKEYPDDAIDPKLSGRGVFYRNQLSFLPAGCEHRFFFKHASDEKARHMDLDPNDRGHVPSPPGWDLHTVIYNGSVVMEAYTRNGSALTDHEYEGVLALNKGDSHWVFVPNEQRKDSVFGYYMETEDGVRRALRKGNTVLVYFTELDSLISKNSEAKAPESLSGF